MYIKQHFFVSNILMRINSIFFRLYICYLKKMTEKQQQKQLENKIYPLNCFEKYTNFELINETELLMTINFICRHLNEDHTYNYGYWYDMYSYTTKSKIVLSHRKNRGGKPVVRLGECVCEEKVINFLKNPDKRCNCDEGFASVYFNKVF